MRTKAPKSTPEISVHISPEVQGNPYQSLLVRALEERDVRSIRVRRLPLKLVLTARRSRDIIHLHWPELIVKSDLNGWGGDLQTLVKAAHLLLVLSIARARRIRIVWTVHNLLPHEVNRPRAYHLLNRCVAHLAHTVIAHSQYAASRARPAYGRSDIKVVYHGNYLGYYPRSKQSRADTRKSLGLPPASHVFLAFGFVRPYKRLPELIAAFRRLKGPEFRLLIAGLPFTLSIKSELEQLAAADPRIVLRLERITDDMVRALHDAADVAVFAYQDIFSSGALMLSLSCGLPAIVPEGSTAIELGEAPIIQSYAPGELQAALERSVPTSSEDRRSATLIAEHHGWDAMAASVLGKAW